jgi:RNA polymerase sigma-70 factor, ECF subfamily
MGEQEPGKITILLGRWREGDPDAEARLFELVMPDLRRLAAYFMNGEPDGHTLSSKALINEAYLRLGGATSNAQDHHHFFALFARAMRRQLIDHARRRPAVAVGPLDPESPDLVFHPDQIDTAIAVDRALTELEAEHPERCTIVEAKFFLGMTDTEVAEALGLTLRTMQRRWQEARAELAIRLGGHDQRT